MNCDLLRVPRWKLSRLIVALAFALLSICVRAQGHFEQCQLIIHVRTADEKPAGRLQVELISPAGTSVAMSATNVDGTAFFEVPSGVTYHARISGENVQTLETEFFIMGSKLSDTENFVVRSKASTSSQSPSGSSPTVSVIEMNVPPKAKEEMQKGMEAFDKGNMAKAQKSFEKAIEIYPQYARAYGNLGVIANKSGDRNKAVTMFSKAIEIDDHYFPAYVNLARMDVQDKKYAQAESLLEKVMVLNPDMPEALEVLASAEYGSGQYDKALADAQRVHTLPHHEQFANVHLLAAQVLEMENRNQEAIAEYQLFLKEAPGSAQAKLVQKAVSDLQASKN